jgi:hypothetical protein
VDYRDGGEIYTVLPSGAHQRDLHADDDDTSPLARLTGLKRNSTRLMAARSK